MINKSLLAIDWDARMLRMVMGTMSKRSARIDQVVGVPVPADVNMRDAVSMGTFIRQALDKAKISPRRAVVNVPREQANFYTLRLPKATLNDLAGMVAFQIPKELPYPVDQAAVDFSAAAEEQQTEIHDVLVAALRNEQLDFYAQVFAQAGLKLQHVGLRPNASEFAVNALLEATPHERVLFVDVGPVTTEIDVIHNGRLVFSRAASVVIPESFAADDTSRTGSDVGEGEGETPFSLTLAADRSAPSLDGVVAELMIEVTRSIEAYRVGNPSANLNHAVIGGNTDIEEALAEAIQKQYRISAQPYNPASCFGWDADRGAAAGAFAATLGLVLAQSAPVNRRFDFLHPKRAETRAERRIKRAPLAAATAALFVAAGVVFYVLYVKPQYDLRNQLRADIRDIKKQLDAHEEFEQMVAALQQYEQQQIVWLDKFYDVVAKLPDEKKIVLNNLDMSQKDHRIRFPYRADDANVAAELIGALDQSTTPDGAVPQFKGTLGATNLKSGDRYAYHGTVDLRVVDREFIED